MNTILASLPRLLVAILVLSCAQPSFADVLAIERFTELCDKGDLRVFDPKENLTVGNLHIHLFVLSPKARTATPYIAVTLKRGTDKDAEIPLFNKICVSDASLSATATSDGDITFISDPKLNVSIIFRRHDSELKYTKWKIDPNDKTSGAPSVWLVEYDANATSHRHPNEDDWCKDPSIKKRVDLSSNRTDVSFVMCPFDPNSKYEYALHLEQKGVDIAPVDIGIDPQIIHQPH
jgi:hypothetical protein